MDEGRFRKNLDLPSVFNNAQSEEERIQLFYGMYNILKPNEGAVDENTKRMLNMIEELVPDKTEGNLYGEHLSEKMCMTKFGFKNGNLYRLDDCDEMPTSIEYIINSTFPSSSFSKIKCGSPDTDESSGIEYDLPPNQQSNLPTPLNLMSKLKVPTSIKSAEVIQLCNSSKNYCKNDIFDESSSKLIQPKLPIKTEKICLKPKTSLIYVKNVKDAMSEVLKEKCMDSPICVIRDLSHAVGLDMSQFTTKSIETIAKDYEMDLREQWKNSENQASTDWFYHSYRYRTNVARYSRYQGDSFCAAIKDGYRLLKRKQNNFDENSNELNSSRASSASITPQRRLSSKRKRQAPPAKDRIFFGTNVDFSDEIFKEQVLELQKLPPFCKLADESNFLSHLGYDLKGMNTAQFYMKIPGNRTPAHLENVSFCSVNLNIGPGDCEWYGVSYENYPLIDKMCKEKKLNFLTDSWWPNYDELIEAGIPTYRFIQKTGDIVFINGGCVHWVEARGWCNNVAWNVGPSCSSQYKLNLMSTEFNRIRKFESLIPMQYLTWNIARNTKIEDQKLRELIRGVLIRSLAHNQLILNYVKSMGMKAELIETTLDRSTTNCQKCQAEIFNLVFANLTQGSKKDELLVYETFCVYCAKQLNLKSMEVWQVYKTTELCEILDRF